MSEKLGDMQYLDGFYYEMGFYCFINEDYENSELFASMAFKIDIKNLVYGQLLADSYFNEEEYSDALDIYSIIYKDHKDPEILKKIKECQALAE